MVARNPSRPKASDIPLNDILLAVDEYAAGGPFPTDSLSQYPAKVVVAKLHKAIDQSLVSRTANKYSLTLKGREALRSE